MYIHTYTRMYIRRYVHVYQTYLESLLGQENNGETRSVLSCSWVDGGEGERWRGVESEGEL